MDVFLAMYRKKYFSWEEFYVRMTDVIQSTFSLTVPWFSGRLSYLLENLFKNLIMVH